MLEEINKSINLYEKSLNRSQSHTLLQPKFIQNPARNLADLVANKYFNISNNNGGLITSIPTRKKIVLPKIKLVKRPNLNNMNLLKHQTLDDLLKKFQNGPPQENNADINNDMNKNKELGFMFNNNNKNKIKISRNKLKKVQFKKDISSIEEIKRRNREIRRRKEKLENETFELRQKEAKKLMASFKVELDGNNKMRRKVGKRYTLFKEILIYLESNNITLAQMLENDPFQHEAYMLPKSYEFINAVKFQNYDFVIEALNSNKNYLFSVDYLGETAYHWAAKLGDLKMMQILVDYGLYHNQKDYKGRTPLYHAVVNNHKDICSYLLNKGANIYLKDKNGLSPADVAKTRDMLSLLSEFMAQPFSNPSYKITIKKLLIDRDKKIKLKDEQKEKEKMLKENEKKIKGKKNDEDGENDEENQELNDDNEEKEKENENENENNEN